jgi:hypothetical protein
MFGRIQLIIIGGMLLLGALTGIYYSWRSSIEREALLEYNQKQLEQSIKDKEELKQKMDLIEIDQQAAIRKNEEDRKALEEQGQTMIDSLNTEEIKKSDRGSSFVLKETVAKLKDARK